MEKPSILERVLDYYILKHSISMKRKESLFYRILDLLDRGIFTIYMTYLNIKYYGEYISSKRRRDIRRKITNNAFRETFGDFYVVRFKDDHFKELIKNAKKHGEPFRSIFLASAILYSKLGPIVGDFKLIYLAAGTDVSPALLPAREIIFNDINPRDDECFRLKKVLEHILKRKIDIKYVVENANNFVRKTPLNDSIVLSFSTFLEPWIMLEVLKRDKPPALGFDGRTIEYILIALNERYKKLISHCWPGRRISTSNWEEIYRELGKILRRKYFPITHDENYFRKIHAKRIFWGEKFPEIGEIDIQFYPIGEIYFIRKDLFEKYQPHIVKSRNYL